MQKSVPAASTLAMRTETPSYRKTVLPNGVRVVSENIPYVRSVSLGIWANVGSRDESPDRNGISHFLEHMVFKGTRRRSGKEIAQSLESLGGYLNAFTTKEQTCFYARVLDADLPEAMDVLADLVRNPTFNHQELEKEKLVVIEELRNAEDDPEDIIHDYFEKAIFPGHSLGYPIIGTEDNVRRFQRSDLQGHLAAHYLPEQIVVAAAGNVEHERLVKLVRSHLGGERLTERRNGGSRSHARHPGPARTQRGQTVGYTRPITQAHVCIGTVGYSIRHEDRYPLLVLNALLGEGMSSRLYQTIREKHGLAYSVYSFVSMLSDTGVFGTYLGTDKAKLDDAIDLVHREFRKLVAKPVSRGELERTKSQMKGTIMLGLENMSGRMIRLGSAELYFETYISLDSILKRVDAVTTEAVQRVAADLFGHDGLTTVTIRPS